MAGEKHAREDSAFEQRHRQYHQNIENYEHEASVANPVLENLANLPPAKRRSSTAVGGNQARTGQACDRCKARKIRCDSSENGCMPCRQNNTECTTTDRVSHRVFVRGHTESLERHCENLKNQVAALQDQLRGLGVEPRTDTSTPPDLAQDSGPPSVEQPTRRSAEPQPPRLKHNIPSPQSIYALPNFRERAYGDNYLGVSSSPAQVLSQIRGTSVRIFKQDIDIADYLPDDTDKEDNPTSYKFFFNNAYRVGPGYNPPHRPPFPGKAEHESIALEFLNNVNTLLPVLHRPDFMTLVRRVHNDPTFEPTIAQDCILHIVIGHIRYLKASYATGKERLAAATEAFKRYRYALHKLPDLYNNRTLEDVQALILIFGFVKMFPKPGAIWIMANCAFLLCIEMGLHRSSKAWPDPSASRDQHDVEMRKRVFWSMFLIVVNVSTRLGRPVCLRTSDHDVEFPEPCDDRLPEEKDDPNVPLCSWAPAVEMFKLAELFLDTYDCVYTVRQTSQADYELRVKALAARFDLWKKQLPDLRGKDQPQATPLNHVWDLIIKLWGAEFQMLLHHPALCRTTNRNFLNRQFEVCLTASDDFLRAMKEIRDMHHLDRSWTTAVTYIGAIGANLFCYYRLKSTLKPEQLERLTNDMRSAIEVVYDVGELLGDGAGAKIQSHIKAIVEDVLHDLRQPEKPKPAVTAKRAQAAAAQKPANEHQTPSRPTSSSTPLPQIKREPQRSPSSYDRHSSPSSADAAAYTSIPAYGQEGMVLQAQPPQMGHMHYPTDFTHTAMPNQMLYAVSGQQQNMYVNSSVQMVPPHMSGPGVWQQFIDAFSEPTYDAANAYGKQEYMQQGTSMGYNDMSQMNIADGSPSRQDPRSAMNLTGSHVPNVGAENGMMPDGGRQGWNNGMDEGYPHRFRHAR